MGYWGTGYMGPRNRICMWAWDMLTQDMLVLLAQDMWAQDIITRYVSMGYIWGEGIYRHKKCMRYVSMGYVHMWALDMQHMLRTRYVRTGYIGMGYVGMGYVGTGS